jgi:hypothetical protein
VAIDGAEPFDLHERPAGAGDVVLEPTPAVAPSVEIDADHTIEEGFHVHEDDPSLSLENESEPLGGVEPLLGTPELPGLPLPDDGPDEGPDEGVPLDPLGDSLDDGDWDDPPLDPDGGTDPLLLDDEPDEPLALDPLDECAMLSDSLTEEEDLALP